MYYQDHEQHTRRFGNFAHPNLKYMYDGVNPDKAVERHMKEEMRKRQYALDLGRQIEERKKREKMEKDFARAASRERIHHALNAPTPMIPSPSYVSPRQKNIDMPITVAPQNVERKMQRQLFPEKGTNEQDLGVQNLQAQLEQIQEKLKRIEAGDKKTANFAHEKQHVHDVPKKDYFDKKNRNFRAGRMYEEDFSNGVPRVRLKYGEPEETNRIQIEEAKKQQYAKDLQAQIVEKAARDKARKRAEEEYDKKHELDAMNHNPFGKVGGGAPLRNAQGEIEPSLHLLRSPENVKGSNAYVQNSQNAIKSPISNGEQEIPDLNFRQDNPFQSKEERDAKSKLESDYQRALREQIEEKKRLKELEAEKERKETEREERRLAEEQRKMKEQYEREQAIERKKREKALSTDNEESTRGGEDKTESDQREGYSPLNVPIRQAPESDFPRDLFNGEIQKIQEPSSATRPKTSFRISSDSPEPAKRSQQQRDEGLSSMSKLELEKLRQELQRQQNAFQNRISEAVTEKETEMMDLRERANIAEEDREAARRELDMIKAEILFRKNVSFSFVFVKSLSSTN